MMLRDLYAMSPIFLVAFTGIFVLLVDVFTPRKADARTDHLGWLNGLGNLAALGLVFKKWWWGGYVLTSPFLAGRLSLDLYTLFAWGLIAGLVALTSLGSAGWDRQNGLHHGEYHGLLSLAGVGMMVMVAASDLVVFFVALETMSLAVYALVALKRTCPLGAEAALKYFLNGAVAAAVLLYGLVLVWGETGSTAYEALALSGPISGLTFVGLLMILVGLAFKVALAPFHLWAPDAYQGAPAPISGLMAGAVKAAGFAALFRFLFTTGALGAGRSFGLPIPSILLVLALLSMAVGSLLALHQRDVKRILAWSGVVHAGYLTLGVFALPAKGLASLSPAIPFYLATYGLANLGAFLVLALLERRDGMRSDLEGLRGLGFRRPFAAFVLVICLASMAGFPPAAGFLAKFYLFRDIIVLSGGRLTWLVVAALGASLVSVYYYLLPVVQMYMKEPEGPRPLEMSPGLRTALVLILLAVLGLGLLPGGLVDRSERAAAPITLQGRTPTPTDGAKLAPYARKTR